MKISTLSIENFRGINSDKLPIKKVNVIIGENGSGKTSFLEAVFLFTLIKSNYSEEGKQVWLNHMFSSRGDVISSILTLQNSSITINDETLKIIRRGRDKIDIRLGNARLNISLKRSVLFSESGIAGTLYLPQYEIEDEGEGEFTPVYITLYFDSYNIPESIISSAKKRSKLEGLEILKDEVTGQFKLYKGDLPVYVMGRGILKELLIEASMSFADVILVDEIEDSLHPDMLIQLMEKMDKANSTFFLTTHSNEVLKIIYNKIRTTELNVIVLKDKRAKAYSEPEDVKAIMEMEHSLSWIKYA
ncbi:AAA family ATPase [Saccharolobus caldissimus]|uniref:ATPase AAA-type core domain-containing protein n=1 Tax=Saccharolobus caldissimus TaxID=1702097 RepID=A0AAQ4CS12_9CREN|nr:AAA family ATPase [Saccharolobus caldissimus]BDB98593.1 hypothetical protein SACC_16100 [Saccharolobus caldissimus]